MLPFCRENIKKEYLQIYLLACCRVTLENTVINRQQGDWDVESTGWVAFLQTGLLNAVPYGCFPSNLNAKAKLSQLLGGPAGAWSPCSWPCPPHSYWADHPIHWPALASGQLWEPTPRAPLPNPSLGPLSLNSGSPGAVSGTWAWRV